MAASPFFPKVPSNWAESTELLHPSELSVRVYIKKDIQKKDVQTVLFAVHGFGEQSDRYEHFPFYLDAEVDAIVMLDLPGHGLSYGQRGHCRSINDFFDALETAWTFATQRWDPSKTKYIWFAHSFGSLLSLAFLAERPDLPLKRVICSAPLLALSMPVPVVKKTVSQLIAPLFGSLSLSNEIQGEIISSMPEVGEEYLRNPLNHSKITPRMFSEMTSLMDRMSKNFDAEFSYSLYFLLPQNDRLVSWQAGYDFARGLKMKSGVVKRIENWPDGHHETFNDVDRERVFNALSEWIQTA